MVATGHEPVHPVGGPEHGQQDGRRRLTAGPEQEPEEQRDAGQPHQRDGVGHGQDPVEPGLLHLSGCRTSDRFPPELLADALHARVYEQGRRPGRRCRSAGGRPGDGRRSAGGRTAVGRHLGRHFRQHGYGTPDLAPNLGFPQESSLRRGTGPDAPTGGPRRNAALDGGALRRGLRRLRGQPLLRPAAPPPHLPGPRHRVGDHRPGHHRGPDRLRARARAHRAPRRHPHPPAAGAGHPLGGRPGPLHRLGRSRHRRPDRGRGRGRPVLGGRPDPRALRRHPGQRQAAGTDRGHRDERPAARHPVGPDLLRAHRRGGRMAGRVRLRRR